MYTGQFDSEYGSSSDPYTYDTFHKTGGCLTYWASLSYSIRNLLIKIMIKLTYFLNLN
jgi:hypothetical protein